MALGSDSFSLGLVNLAGCVMCMHFYRRFQCWVLISSVLEHLSSKPGTQLARSWLEPSDLGWVVTMIFSGGRAVRQVCWACAGWKSVFWFPNHTISVIKRDPGHAMFAPRSKLVMDRRTRGGKLLRCWMGVHCSFVFASCCQRYKTSSCVCC